MMPNHKVKNTVKVNSFLSFFLSLVHMHMSNVHPSICDMQTPFSIEHISCGCFVVSQNWTAIADHDNRRCFVMPLNRNAVRPPKSFADLLEKYGVRNCLRQVKKVNWLR